MDNKDQTGEEWPRALLEHLDSLYGFAISLSGNSADAEDLVQETYAQAARSYGKLRPDSNIKGWLFVIARNTWLKQLRQSRSGPRFEPLHDPDMQQWIPGNEEDPHDAYVRLWEREEIRTALASLSATSREIIILREIEGFTYREIAEILKCPLGTIMSRLARARTKLKTELSAHDRSKTQNTKYNFKS